MHVTPWVVGAVVVAEAVQDRLGFELILVRDWIRRKKNKTEMLFERRMKERRKKRLKS